MSAAFAAAESRLNMAVLARLSNATAVIGGVGLDVIFRSGYAESLGIIGGSEPLMICASADVAGIAEGQALTVSGTNFTVAAIEHDSIFKTGLATLRLEKA